MSTENQKPRLPEVGEFVRHVGKLKTIETIPPPPQPPPQEDYIFEEIEARGELRRNGTVLKEIATWNDFYGHETSVKIAIEEMQEYAAKQAITSESEIEAVVVKLVTYYRARPVRDKENFYDGRFLDFRRLEYGCRRDVPPDVETVVWSTKTA